MKNGISTYRVNWITKFFPVPVTQNSDKYLLTLEFNGFLINIKKYIFIF